ncbi:MAG: MarC family protein [Alphaproteobacteria bacterium]|nr:MarC family protein [Alphaproteobacteria bacterium]
MSARAGVSSVTGIQPLDWQTIFALLFLMLGPIKILGPFVAMTQGTEPVFQRRLATRAFLFSVAAVAIAAGMGRRMLASFAIPLQVLVLTGGLILFLVALQQVLQQYSVRPLVRTEPPTFALAFTPLAFPTIVTPYGIAAVIIFMAVAPDATASAIVAGLVLLVLALDWVAMLFAHTVIRWLGAVLQLFGVVLGVTQVALGLEIILRSLGRLGMVEAGGP